MRSHSIVLIANLMQMNLFCNTIAFMTANLSQSDLFVFDLASSGDYHADVSAIQSRRASTSTNFSPHASMTKIFTKYSPNRSIKTPTATPSQPSGQPSTQTPTASPTAHQLYFQNTKLTSTTINDTNYNYTNSTQLDLQHDRKHPTKEFIIFGSLIIGFIASSMIAVCCIVSKKQTVMISQQKPRFESNGNSNLQTNVQPFTRENVAIHDKLDGFSYNDYIHTKWHKHGSQYSLSLTLPSLDENQIEYSPDLDDQSSDSGSCGPREWVDERVFDILKNETIQLGIHKKVPKNERYVTPRVTK